MGLNIKSLLNRQQKAPIGAFWLTESMGW